MKKLILGTLALLLLIISSLSASAYHQYTYGNYNTYSNYNHIPNVNPYFAQHYDLYEHRSDDKYERAVKAWDYQRFTSPYVLIRSPYGKKPWHKAYGDLPHDYRTTEESWNSFWGFPHLRGQHCHGPGACHNHNIFPDSHQSYE